mgnify:CR=1 FL=1
MPKEYTREQLRQLYIKLPEEIKDLASSDETANNIEDICKRNGIVDERVGIISDLTRNVLLGVLPPEEFQKTLEKELGLKTDLAKKISQEIYRFIFYPVKTALEELYKIEITPTEKPKEETNPEEKKAEAAPVKDSYRELIE